MKKLFYIVLFLLFASTGWATNYYVTQSGAGSQNGTSLANAWSVSAFNNSSNWSTTENASKIDPGDTVYFSGTFTDEVKPAGSGTSGNYITLDGWEGGSYNATDGNRTNMTSLAKLVNEVSSTNVGMEIQGRSYLIIQDFHFDGSVETGSESFGVLVWDDGTNRSEWITFRDNYFHEYANMAWYTSRLSHSSGYGSAYLTFGGSAGNGNEIYDVGSSSSGHGMRFSNSMEFICSYNKVWANDITRNWGTGAITWGTGATAVTKGLIEYNYAATQNFQTTGGEGGIGGKGGSYLIIRYNKIEDNDDTNSGIGITATYDDGHHNYIYANYVSDNSYGIMVGAGSVEFSYNGTDPHDIYVFSNIIELQENDGVFIGNYETLGTDEVYNVWVFNNTFYKNGDSPGSTARTAINISKLATATINLANNIFYWNRPSESNYRQMYVHSASDTVPDTDYSRWYFPSQSIEVYWGDAGSKSLSGLKAMSAPYGPQETNGTEGDPGLTNPSGGDFTISSTGSAVYNAGTPMGSGNIASVTIQGTAYGIPWGAGLGSNTDFSGTNPSAWTIEILNRGDYQWDQGAFVYAEEAEEVIGNEGVSIQ